MMIKKYIIFISLILCGIKILAQDTISLQGNYYGKNIYVTNPSLDNDTLFCVKKVLINSELSKDEIRSNSFEIDFCLLNIEEGRSVKIQIIHHSKCTPQIVNPEVIETQNNFLFSNVKIDKTGKIIWDVKGNLYGPFTIEQYKWKKWLTAKTVEIADSLNSGWYEITIKPHSGYNQFRISHTDEKGNVVYSKLIKYRPSTVKEVFITSLKVKDEILFTEETAYEIYDDIGNFIKDGYSLKVTVSDLPKGKYYINYDNKTELISKK